MIILLIILRNNQKIMNKNIIFLMKKRVQLDNFLMIKTMWMIFKMKKIR